MLLFSLSLSLSLTHTHTHTHTDTGNLKHLLLYHVWCCWYYIYIYQWGKRTQVKRLHFFFLFSLCCFQHEISLILVTLNDWLANLFQGELIIVTLSLNDWPIIFQGEPKWNHKLARKHKQCADIPCVVFIWLFFH